MLQVGRLQTTELFLELCGFSRNKFKDRVHAGICFSKFHGLQDMFFCWMPKVSLAAHLGSCNVVSSSQAS